MVSRERERGELAVVAVAADSGLSEEPSMKEAPKEVQAEDGSTVELSKVAVEELTAVKLNKAVPPEGDSMMVVPQEAEAREAVEVVKANLVAEEDSMTVVPVAVNAAAEAEEEATEVEEEAEEMPNPSTSSSKAIGPRLAILKSVS